MAITHATNTAASIKDLWSTPVEVVSRIEQILGIQFEVDVCGTPSNRKAPIVITDATWWRIHPHINGLNTDWSRLGQYCFMNPPFSQKERWIAMAEYFSKKGLTTVGMLPVAKCATWYRHMEQGVSRLLMPDKRINYLHPLTGLPVKGVSFETVLPVWEPKRQITYERITLEAA